MRIADLIAAMERVAPTRLAQSWDNVGLLAGDPERELSGPVLLTIDLTRAVLGEAQEMRSGAIVAYHPPLFHPLKRLGPGIGEVVWRAIESGIAIYSPHTALDAAPGGMTDWLCEGLAGSGDVRALEPHADTPATQEFKVVVFVPDEHADTLRKAMASAGAGIIGAYRVCSFASAGTGTFFAEPGASPAVGGVGSLERVRELRLEMVCARSALPLIIQTIHEFHPYETPAVDVYALVPRPTRSTGAGRRLVLDRPASLEEIARRVATHLGVEAVSVAAAPGAPDRITHVGCCPGAGSSVAMTALAEGCQLFITGEMKHHEVLSALDRGLSILLAGHTNTERGYLPRLARSLRELLPGVKVSVSRLDRDPLRSL